MPSALEIICYGKSEPQEIPPTHKKLNRVICGHMIYFAIKKGNRETAELTARLELKYFNDLKKEKEKRAYMEQQKKIEKLAIPFWA
jgi:hypothetical protein